MKKYTANYSNTNNNFVIQNLSGERVESVYIPAICIIRNIIQRGCPTIPSQFLRSQIGEVDFLTYKPLIDIKVPVWERIIRGDVKNNYYPAQTFFNNLIPKYFPEYPFIQQLIIPEVPINYITQLEVLDFQNQQVDFFLPQAFLVIEIDGSQHDSIIDKVRDNHLLKFGVETVRISTDELQSESDDFISKISKIKQRIENVLTKQKEYKLTHPSFFTFEDYKDAIINPPDLNDSTYKAASIIRLQLTILELLEIGKLSFDKAWKITVLNTEQTPFEEIAIEDLLIWFKQLFNLQRINFEKPTVTIIRVKSFDELINSNSQIKIDFSLIKRYTDEFQNHSDIIFIRTDYIEYYKYYKNTNAVQPEYVGLENINQFKVSATDLFDYKISIGDNWNSEKSLLFFLKNIFGYDEFYLGQLPIIINSLSRNDTIGLLPTGGGKSVCYQLAIFLQPGISFVVCPIKSLMYDQKQDLESAFISRTNHITSDNDGEDKNKIMKEFASGKYMFIFISPERFQIKVFRQYLLEVNNSHKISYAVIDEVHCLSEWGHDFRTSYLNLSSTINRLCTNFRFIGLTATASINVLNDIKIEFGIKQENVKTLVDYTRKELNFEVIDDNGDKLNSVVKVLNELNENENIFNLQANDSKCGIIFTPNVNGPRGCYKLSNTLSQKFNVPIKFYSGKIPAVNNNPIMHENEFEKFKQTVQNDFKINKFTLLTATKAFGMGVNKGNIHYTIHFGIPGSMESLYQEAGRAGRDKIKFSNNKAKCLILFSRTNNDKLLEEVWNRTTTLPQLLDLLPQINGDVNSNLFLFTSGLVSITSEYQLIINLINTYAQPLKAEVNIRAQQLGSNKAKTEKAIYRLKQLGVINDWTITDFFRGEFQVDFADYSNESIKNCLLNTIHKYDKDFKLDHFEENEISARYQQIWNSDRPVVDKCIVTLLQWAYSHFAYNRIQSLKNIYENCNLYVTQAINNEEFKKRLENYFRFSEASFMLQHIAENPKDYNNWFSLFYQFENNDQTNIIINNEQRQSLLANLSRFLESYQYNIGLDLVSGLIRLLVNDFDNPDGKNRFESSLKQIVKYDFDVLDNILSKVLDIGSHMSIESKNQLSKTILDYFPDDLLMLKKVQRGIGDHYSTSILMSDFTTRLKKINNNIYAGLEQLR